MALKKTNKTQTNKAVSLTISVVDIKGKKKGTVKLPIELFGVPMNKSLVAQAVRVYLANQRQAGAKTKTRGDVRGSGRKIWRQKGTGRARHGHRYAGIFVGGGKAHGPNKRTFEKDLNRKMKQKALGAALSSQLQSDNIIVVDGIEKLEPKTKLLIDTLDKITGSVKCGKLSERTILATPEKTESVYRAGKNIENLTIRQVMLLNTYEVVSNKRIIFSKKAIETLSGNKAKL